MTHGRIWDTGEDKQQRQFWAGLELEAILRSPDGKTHWRVQDVYVRAVIDALRRIWDTGEEHTVDDTNAEWRELYKTHVAELRARLVALEREREEDRAAMLWLLGIVNERMRLALGRPLDLQDEGAQPFGAAIQRAQKRP